jgi:hypothetical protein
MAALPMLGGGVQRLQQNALKEWNINTLRSVAPPGATITTAGNKGFADAQSALTKSYEAIWDATIPLRGDVSAAWAQMVPQIGSRLPRVEASRLIRNLRQADELLKAADNEAAVGVSNGARLERIDDMLRDFADKAAKAGDDTARDVYREARNVFRQALPEDVNEALSMLDGLYAKYSILQRAATSKRALSSGGVFTPDDLMNAVKVRNSAKSLARGDARLQEEAAKAMEVFEGLTGRVGKIDRLISGTLATPFTPLLAAGRAVLPREFNRRLLTGRYQSKPAELARALQRYGERGLTTRTGGAAVAASVDDDSD